MERRLKLANLALIASMSLGPRLPAFEKNIISPPGESITLSSHIENFPIAEDCILPFDDATPTQRFKEALTLSDGSIWKRDDLVVRHLGVDFIAPGDQKNEVEVKNICDGQFVTTAEFRSSLGRTLGNVIVMKYFDGSGYFYAVYAHLDKYLVDTVKPGDFIKKGQVLGIMGNSGGWASKHLHIHMWKEKGWNIFVEPFGKKNYDFYPDTWEQKRIDRYLVDPLTFIPKKPSFGQK